MNFEDVRIGDVLKLKQQRFVVSFVEPLDGMQPKRICTIYKDGFVQWYEKHEWEDLMENFVDLISRNKAVTVSVGD